METSKLLEKLKTLKVLLGQQELVLTGSLALAYHGLADWDKANDIDLLIINPTPTATEVLKRLTEAHPSKKHSENSPVDYNFFYEDVKINVWVKTSFEDKNYLVTNDGVKIASVSSIVKAKKSYNRPKDFIQLMQIAGRIFDEKEFKEKLTGINTSDSEDYPEAV